jgi:hypothetical protein
MSMGHLFMLIAGFSGFLEVVIMVSCRFDAF